MGPILDVVGLGQGDLGAVHQLDLVGDRIDARSALDIGLVNRVVPAGEVMTVAMDLARRMTRNGPLAMRAAKVS